MSTIANLKPEIVWKHFYSLTQIPRPSKHEEKVIKFMKEFGEGLGLETIVEEVGNVIIRKPATKGMEKCEGIILQAHLDMVPQKNNDTQHDFLTDPIQTYIDGEWVKAKGTTLGADNGLGVAAAMAILEDKTLIHGPIECLFTIDEETGMTGAFGLEAGVLQGKILLNLDSEEEGDICVGCAGGVDVEAKLTYKEISTPKGYVAYDLSITGCKGGHSGVDINIGRANPNKLLFRFLSHCLYNFDIKLVKANGGTLRNAIPRESFATVLLADADAKNFEKEVEKFCKTVQKEFAETEPDMFVETKKAETPKRYIQECYAEKIIKAIFACPHGVERMSYSMSGIVETSNNVGIISIEDGLMKVCCLTRSSVDSAKEATMYKIGIIFDLIGAYVSFSGAYPGWKPDMKSEILKIMKSSYKNLFGKEPNVSAIHAGLECALFSTVYPDWEMISFGPTLQYPHSPDERLEIATVQKFWDLLVEILKNAPLKK
ncbi:MAG: aminoacyl-histidine dipeptidase [Bacteroidales bacterium]|jgi:dipeptidase D|nr:aminoacyl-histidine dipeptidase [Bacteroidales bacterium]